MGKHFKSIVNMRFLIMFNIITSNCSNGKRLFQRQYIAQYRLSCNNNEIQTDDHFRHCHFGSEQLRHIQSSTSARAPHTHTHIIRVYLCQKILAFYETKDMFSYQLSSIAELLFIELVLRIFKIDLSFLEICRFRWLLDSG